MAIKNNVQALNNVGYDSFDYDKAGDPNVTSNPLPNHSRPRINVVLESPTKKRKSSIRDVMTPMGIVYKELIQAKFLQSRKKEAIEEESLNKGYCQYHTEVQRHVIQECIEFRDTVQNLMDRKEIEFSKSIDPSICVITCTMYSRTPLSTGLRPIMIFHDNEVAKDEMPKVSTPVLVVEVPRPFPYES